MIKNILAIVLILILNIKGFAQQSIGLDTVLVNASQIPLKITETGRNITVLDARQIAAIPANSLYELLQTVSGVEVQSRGGFGVQGDITMRGSTFSQVLILIDGMKINDPLTAHFNGNIPVTPAEIERIEILRGAAAAMYGADAVGGVINIISKTFSNPKVGTQISGQLQYGDHDLISTNHGFSIKKGKAIVGGGMSIQKSTGEYFPEKVIDTITTLSPYNSNFNVQTLATSFAYQFNEKWVLRARTAYDYRDFDARYFYTTSKFDKAHETVTQWFSHMQVERKTENMRTDLNAAYKRNTDKFVFSPDFASTNEHLTNLFNFTANHMIFVNPAITLKAGAQYDYRDIQSNDRGNHSDFHAGLYAMGVYKKKSFNLTTSLRADYDANYAFEFTPQVNFSYVRNKMVFRASGGRSIRAADYTERYVSNHLKNLTPGRSLGNPDLSAEKGWSEEIGLDYSISKKWQIKSTLFNRNASDLIDYVLTNQTQIGSVSETGSLIPNANYYFAQNISKVNTRGFELESNLHFPFANKSALTWNSGYTFLQTNNADDITSIYIASHARHLVTTQVMYSNKKIDLSLSGVFKERNARIASEINESLESSYQVWHFRAAYHLTEIFGIQAQVQNLFNVSYSNILGAPMPSRWLMAGVKWDLK